MEIVFAVVTIAILAAWLYRERENAKERAVLSDRIMSPAAFQAAAMDRLDPIPFPAESDSDLYTDELPLGIHDDLRLQALMEDR